MSDDKRGWRALPPVLVMAIVLQVAAAAYYAVWRLAEPGEHWFARAMLTSRGIHFAIDLMAIVGVFELARRSTGRTRAALTGAWIAFAVGSVVSISFDWVFTLWAPGIDSSFDKVWLALSYVGYGIDMVAAICLAVAVLPKLPIAIGGFVLLAIGHPPPIVYGWIGDGRAASLTFNIGAELAFAVGFALLAITCASAGTTESRRAVAGLRQVGGALKLRVAAALCGTGLLLLVMMSHSGGDGALGVVKLAMMSAAVLNFVAQMMMSFGAMNGASAELPDLPRWAMAVAAALALWAAGVMAAQLPHLYEVLYGHEHDSWGGNYAEALATALPLVVTAAVGIVAGAIGALAARRGDEQLRTHASGKGVGFVALMLASIGITAWVLPDAKSEGGLIGIMFCAAGCGLWAMILGARLCSLGADAIDAEPGLPAAKIV